MLIKSGLFCAFSVLVAVAAGSYWIGTARLPIAGEGRGQIAINPATIDLGEGDPGQALEGSFLLSNVGKGPLNFAVRVGCSSCTKVTPQHGTVAVGESTTLRVAVKLPAQPGSENNATLEIESNDPHNPTNELNILSATRAPFKVHPRHLSFGQVSRAGSDAKAVVIVYREKS